MRSRQNNLKRKLSKKNNKLFRSSLKTVGGGKLHTEITVIINPNKTHDPLVIEGAFAFMKLETSLLDILPEKIMNGGAQVCTGSRAGDFFPTETFSEILNQKMNNAQHHTDCVNYIEALGYLSNVDTDDAGLPGNRVMDKVVVNVRNAAGGPVFNFFELNGSSLMMPEFSHATIHPNSHAPNNALGAVHSYGSIASRASKIEWYMCAQSDCDDDTLNRVPDTYTFQKQINTNAAIPNIRNRITPKYFITTDIINGHRPESGPMQPAEPFYIEFLNGLREYLLSGIDINLGAFANLDQNVKLQLSRILENVCHDVNYDRQFTSAQLRNGQFPISIRNNNIGRNYCRNQGTYPNRDVIRTLHHFDIWAVHNPRTGPEFDRNYIQNAPLQSNPYTTQF